MDIASIAASLVILLFSVVIHELCHGLAADALGDHTARDMGRLTLNPLPHLDLFGSMLLPLFLYVAHSPILFGAAKPVPVNLFNLRHPKRDTALVSLAGPAANFVLAVIFALPIRASLAAPGTLAFSILLKAAVLNIVLGVFNLIPIPPLDGSKVVASLFSEQFMYRIFAMERFGFLLIILFLYTGLIDRILVPALRAVSTVFLGFPAV